MLSGAEGARRKKERQGNLSLLLHSGVRQTGLRRTRAEGEFNSLGIDKRKERI